MKLKICLIITMNARWLVINGRKLFTSSEEQVGSSMKLELAPIKGRDVKLG